MTSGSAVTVIGLGSMGSAQARALLRRGHEVTVWNRTAERAASLLKEGAKLARTPAEAFAASPLVIMCVLDYAVADAILAEAGVASALSGKTFVQLSTGGPAQVYAQQAKVREHGGRFVAGGILAYPRSIGRPNCLILYAGDPSFEEHRATLLSLAGSSQYLGTDPAAAIGAYFALSSYMISALALFFETAAVSRHYGISIDVYYLLARIVTDEILEGIRDGAHRVAIGDFDGKLASIDLTIAGMQEVCTTFRQTGMPVKMTEALVEALEIASADGAGADDIARLTETIWSHRRGDFATT
jgi:3-hydroxyisobutyrate dehydrogenase-like beta-hydroxyacid dehydrogenase